MSAAILQMLAAAGAATPPSYVNDAAFSNQGGASAASGAVTLPGSRVNGNVLIAFIWTQGGSKSFSVGGGWTLGNAISGDANMSSAWAWRIVDGTEAAPTFTWTGSSLWFGQAFQIQGNHTSAPIGAVGNNSGSSATLAISAITSTHDQSFIGCFEISKGGFTVPPLPTGFTAVDTISGLNLVERTCRQTVTTSGGSSSAVSVTVTNQPWHGYLFEIKSP